MGIPGEYDHPRLKDAFARVSAACDRVSVNGRLVSCGIGGLNARPDLIEKFASQNTAARYAMSGADNAILLQAMRKNAALCRDMTQRVKAHR